MRKLKIKAVMFAMFIVGGVLFSIASIEKCAREIAFIWKATFKTLENLKIE